MSLRSDILNLYASGLTPAEIAAEVNVQQIAVISLLEECSPEYQRAMVAQSASSTKPAERATNEFGTLTAGLKPTDRQDMLEVVRQLAYEADNDSIRLKAATYIIDEDAGRHDVARRIGEQAGKASGITLNVMLINEGLNRLKQARAAAANPTTVTLDVAQIPS